MSERRIRQAGVDQRAADSAVAGLVRALGAIELGRPSRQVPLPGHYASVIKLDERLGIALSTDGVGTKLLLAEQLGRFETVGIDCVAMNVNDVICVGAEPLAMLDYIAIERADPEVCERKSGSGWRAARSWPGSRSPAASWHSSARWCEASTSPAPASARSTLDAIVDGSAVRPGDAIVGLPSSGLHSNGYTLARSALEGLPLDEDPEGRLGRPLGDVLLEPTEIYVKAVLELLRSEVEVRGLAHITSGGLEQPRATGGRGRLRDRLPPSRPADLRSDPGALGRLRRGDARGLQHGLRLLLRGPSRERAGRPRAPAPPLRGGTPGGQCGTPIVPGRDSETRH